MEKKRKKIKINKCKYCGEERCDKYSCLPSHEQKKMDTLFITVPAALPYVQDAQPCYWLPLTNDGLSIQTLNLVQVGTQQFNRIGNKICMTKLEWDLKLNPTGVASAQIDNLRMLIVYDKQTNGVVPPIARGAGINILSPYITSGQYTASFVGSNTYSQDINTLERFEILYDKMITVPTTTYTGPTDQTPYYNKGELDLEGRITMYNGTAGGLQNSINTGGLYLGIHGQVAGTILTLIWGYLGTCRLHYHET